MKIIKNFLLALCALSFVALGAAMPWLVSRVQDARLSGFQENLELNSVNLTLQQETGDTISALKMISNLVAVSGMDAVSHLESISLRYKSSSWEGETALTEEEACQAGFAVLEAMEAMDLYSLLSGGVESASAAYVSSAQPSLWVTEDGSSALVWDVWYFWTNRNVSTGITVDDATGKAVQIIESPYGLVEYDDNASMEDIYIQAERWFAFLQDYYDGSIETIEEIYAEERTTYEGDIYWSVKFRIELFPSSGLQSYVLTLEISNVSTWFNC